MRQKELSVWEGADSMEAERERFIKNLKQIKETRKHHFQYIE